MKILQIIQILILSIIAGLLSYNFFVLENPEQKRKNMLIDTFYSASPSQARRAYLSLKLNGNLEIRNRLKKALQSNSIPKKEAALEMLSEIGGDENFNLIQPIVANSNEKLAIIALKALGKFSNNLIQDSLLSVVKGSNVKKQVVALEIIRDKKIKSLLEQLSKIKSKEEPLKSKLEETITALGGKKKVVLNYQDY